MTFHLIRDILSLWVRKEPNGGSEILKNDDCLNRSLDSRDLWLTERCQLLLNRLQTENGSVWGFKPFTDTSPAHIKFKIVMDAIIDMSDEDYEVSTYGGEYHHNCEDCGDCHIDKYGIQIGEISIEINGVTARKLYEVLGNHLKAN